MACEIGWVDPAHADNTMISVRRMPTPAAPLTTTVSKAAGVNTAISRAISRASQWLRLDAGLNAGRQAHRSV